ISATTLEVLAGAGTDATNSDASVVLGGANTVGTVAVARKSATAGVTLDVTYNNAGNLAVGTAGATSGITTGGGLASVTATAGTLTVSQAINAGTGAVTLTTTETDATDAVADDAKLTLSAGVTGGAVKLDAADGISQTAGVISATTLEVLAGAGTDATNSDASVVLGGANTVGTVAVARKPATAGVPRDVTYNHAGNLAVGTAGATSGITTGGGLASVTATAGTLTVSQAINAGTGAVTLTTTETDATDAVADD